MEPQFSNGFHRTHGGRNETFERINRQEGTHLRATAIKNRNRPRVVDLPVNC